MTSQASILPPLDPGYEPASLWTRAFHVQLKESGQAQPLGLALERPDGTISRFDTHVFPHKGEFTALNRRYIERFVKFILWSRGGYRLLVSGDPESRRCCAAFTANGRAQIRLRVSRCKGLRTHVRGAASKRRCQCPARANPHARWDVTSMVAASDSTLEDRIANARR
jgi:hypothetical protein